MQRTRSLGSADRKFTSVSDSEVYAWAQARWREGDGATGLQRGKEAAGLQRAHGRLPPLRSGQTAELPGYLGHVTLLL